MTSFSPTTHPPQSTFTNLAGTAASVDWPLCFLLWTLATQYINLGLVLWTLLVPEDLKGLMSFMARDLHLPVSLVAILFLFSVGISWRGLHPRWWLLATLVGQAVIAAFALVYTVRGSLTLAQLAGHGGLFVLSALGIVAMIPPSGESTTRRNRAIAASKKLLIPTIGAVLLLYAMGLATRPDTGVSLFIQSQFGPPLIVILAGLLAVSAACVIQNRIPASLLFVSLLPLLVYAVMAVALLGQDNDVSLLGIVVHLEFLITALFVVMIQTKEYARARMLQDRQILLDKLAQAKQGS